MKLSKSQIASIVAAAVGYVVANWATISPEISTQLQSQWFVHHPAVRMFVVGACFLVTMYARSLKGSKSGLPDQGAQPPVQ